MRVRGAGRTWSVAVSVCAALVLTACGDDADPGESVTSENVPSSSATTSDAVESSPESPTPPAPVPKALDGNAVQRSVASVLTGSYGIKDVESVRCPRRPEVRPGLTFDCTAVIGGDSKRVPIEILDEEGRYEVGLPL
ncbi:DUF4333 domain-containing protein [Saccharomonospora sp. NB11]|uniref:DUF4333 domain-containing protein n=1 Tax=Saccharomonospora sp. NB11 TaxID=1642298 RepID=UPI0018D0A926|nr:DUF4333 domain-containing protein [Saccharomonospora sp. NB11]